MFAWTLVFAILFVAAVGLGPFAGVMAVFIHNLGIISKLFSEAVEAIDREQQLANEAAAAAVELRDGDADVEPLADGSGDAEQTEDGGALQFLLVTRPKCRRDPAARAALLQLHAGACGGSGAPSPAEWQQQVGFLFANGDNPKRQRKNDDM